MSGRKQAPGAKQQLADLQSRAEELVTEERNGHWWDPNREHRVFCANCGKSTVHEDC